MASVAPLRSPSIRTLVLLAGALLLGLVVLVAAALSLLTTALHRQGKVLQTSMEGVLAAEATNVNVGLLDLATNPAVRQSLEDEIRRTLQVADTKIDSPEEGRILLEATRATEAFLDRVEAPQTPPDVLAASKDNARRSLDRLVTINIDQARDAEATAARWDRWGDIIGAVAGLSMVLVTGGLVVWVRRAIVAPLQHLTHAVDRFPSEPPDVRLPESAASDLHTLAAHMNRTAGALRAAGEARATFLGGVAHDLRNPLAAIQMSLGILQRDPKLPNEARCRHTLEVIERQVARLARMAGDFLDATRIEAGQLELRRERRDLRGIVVEVAELFRDASPRHPVKLVNAAEPLVVEADPLRVEQILTNLLSNAIKYSPGGGEVELSAWREGGEARVAVSDQGLGIAPDEIERIWEPFRRTGSSAESIPGVGLGLSIVRRLAEAHGGRLVVTSSEGHGSTFTLSLPLAEKQTLPPPRAVPPGTQPVPR